MLEAFAQWPEAIASTLEIAERCDVELELGRQLIPNYACPDGMAEREYLRERVLDGLTTRYGDPVPAVAVERAEHELRVIERMGFSAYFLIVWDYVKYAKGRGIAVGPGRGSAAGSIVNYCLRITEIDPLRHDLLFERFLNPERRSMPDIDIDFSVRGRDDVIRYVVERYGRSPHPGARPPPVGLPSRAGCSAAWSRSSDARRSPPPSPDPHPGAPDSSGTYAGTRARTAGPPRHARRV